jgi:chromosome segregation ATPase
MNTQKSVFNKISKIEREVESKEVELSEVQKVELARKPQSLLSELRKLDSKMQSQESKMSKIYQNYKSAQKEFVSFMDDAVSQTDDILSDIGRIMDAAQELGVTDFKSIDGLEEANDLQFKLNRIAQDAKKLYPRLD